jgi:hypothetical protein
MDFRLYGFKEDLAHRIVAPDVFVNNGAFFLFCDGHRFIKNQNALPTDSVLHAIQAIDYGFLSSLYLHSLHARTLSATHSRYTHLKLRRQVILSFTIQASYDPATLLRCVEMTPTLLMAPHSSSFSPQHNYYYRFGCCNCCP